MKWLERRRDAIRCDAVKGAASVIRCFEIVGETRWTNLQVLDALSGQHPNGEIVSAARSAVASVRAEKDRQRAKEAKAVESQRNAASTY